MTRTTASLVAPGVHRLGDWFVNFYIVEGADGMTLVDGGLPAHYAGLVAALDRIGRRVSDIDAVVVTHAHLDHIGLAERVRLEAGAAVWVHQDDAALITDPRHLNAHAKPERTMAPYALRRPAMLRGPLHMARCGAFGVRTVGDVRTFAEGQTLDVPGHPRVLSVPGHTPGSSAFVFADHEMVFAGDALVTHDSISGHVGPSVVCGAFTHDSEQALVSLDALAQLDVPLVLPGHGEPFAEGVRAAVDQAQRHGVS
jgi:glyoxylase-like metal-dependent hydrolase (beta-lactamase superfamily II)